MNWFGAMVIFILSSWMVFFATASAGIRTGADSGSEPPDTGCDISAPVEVDMGKKAMMAMAGGGGITCLIWGMAQMGVFSYLVSIAHL